MATADQPLNKEFYKSVAALVAKRFDGDLFLEEFLENFTSSLLDKSILTTQRSAKQTGSSSLSQTSNTNKEAERTKPSNKSIEELVTSAFYGSSFKAVTEDRAILPSLQKIATSLEKLANSQNKSINDKQQKDKNSNEVFSTNKSYSSVERIKEEIDLWKRGASNAKTMTLAGIEKVKNAKKSIEAFFAPTLSSEAASSQETPKTAEHHSKTQPRDERGRFVSSTTQKPIVEAESKTFDPFIDIKQQIQFLKDEKFSLKSMLTLLGGKQLTPQSTTKTTTEPKVSSQPTAEAPKTEPKVSSQPTVEAPKTEPKVSSQPTVELKQSKENPAFSTTSVTIEGFSSIALEALKNILQPSDADKSTKDSKDSFSRIKEEIDLWKRGASSAKKLVSAGYQKVKSKLGFGERIPEGTENEAIEAKDQLPSKEHHSRTQPRDEKGRFLKLDQSSEYERTQNDIIKFVDNNLEKASPLTKLQNNKKTISSPNVADPRAEEKSDANIEKLLQEILYTLEENHEHQLQRSMLEDEEETWPVSVERFGTAAEKFLLTIFPQDVQKAIKQTDETTLKILDKLNDVISTLKDIQTSIESSSQDGGGLSPLDFIGRRRGRGRGGRSRSRGRGRGRGRVPVPVGRGRSKSKTKPKSKPAKPSSTAKPKPSSTAKPKPSSTAKPKSSPKPPKPPTSAKPGSIVPKGTGGMGRGLASGASKAAGAAGVVVGVALTAAELADIDAMEKSGEITPEQAKQMKGGAVGGGIGGAAGGGLGAWGGAAAGAAIGSFFFPGVGTVIGGVIGGLVGGIAGGMAGDAVGRSAGEALTSTGEVTNAPPEKKEAAERAKELAEQMKIDTSEGDLLIEAQGGVPISINGQPVPMELLTDEEKESIGLAKQAQNLNEKGAATTAAATAAAAPVAAVAGETATSSPTTLAAQMPSSSVESSPHVQRLRANTNSSAADAKDLTEPTSYGQIVSTPSPTAAPQSTVNSVITVGSFGPSAIETLKSILLGKDVSLPEASKNISAEEHTQNKEKDLSSKTGLGTIGTAALLGGTALLGPAAGPAAGILGAGISSLFGDKNSSPSDKITAESSETNFSEFHNNRFSSIKETNEQTNNDNTLQAILNNNQQTNAVLTDLALAYNGFVRSFERFGDKVGAKFDADSAYMPVPQPSNKNVTAPVRASNVAKQGNTSISNLRQIHEEFRPRPA